jgi:two-component system, chemotaxis family, chemotaxis protein CheY
MTYQFEHASILVVDDFMPMASLISSLLRAFNFKAVYVATGPEQALALFIRHNPDIVLTDWIMEPYDGLELVRKIRTDPKSPNRFVPIIIMTGYSARAHMELARNTGVTEFLVKPFRARDLYARIEHLIEKPRQFVETPRFFGPDRRRKRIKDDAVPKRREVDHPQGPAASTGERDVAVLLKELQQEVRGLTGYDEKAGYTIKTERDPETGIVTYEAWSKDGKPDRADGPAIIKRDTTTGTVTHEARWNDGKQISSTVTGYRKTIFDN